VHGKQLVTKQVMPVIAGDRQQSLTEERTRGQLYPLGMSLGILKEYVKVDMNAPIVGHWLVEGS
jgi:hypothetical protein